MSFSSVDYQGVLTIEKNLIYFGNNIKARVWQSKKRLVVD